MEREGPEIGPGMTGVSHRFSHYHVHATLGEILESFRWGGLASQKGQFMPERGGRCPLCVSRMIRVGGLAICCLFSDYATASMKREKGGFELVGTGDSGDTEQSDSRRCSSKNAAVVVMSHTLFFSNSRMSPYSTHHFWFLGG